MNEKKQTNQQASEHTSGNIIATGLPSEIITQNNNNNTTTIHSALNQ